MKVNAVWFTKDMMDIFILSLFVHTDSYTEYRDTSMSDNFDIVPYSLSLINYTKFKWEYQSVMSVWYFMAGNIS